MPGLVPGIHVLARANNIKTWMAGTGPAMTRFRNSDGFLEFLGGAESDFLARLDLDRLAGRRIAAHAGGALAHLQNAEAAHADALTLLEVFDEEPHQVVEDRLGLLFRDLVGFRESRREVLDGDGSRCGCLCHGRRTPGVEPRRVWRRRITPGA